jgi:hypothetical protein
MTLILQETEEKEGFFCEGEVSEEDFFMALRERLYEDTWQPGVGYLPSREIENILEEYGPVQYLEANGKTITRTFSEKEEEPAETSSSKNRT